MTTAVSSSWARLLKCGTPALLWMVTCGRLKTCSLVMAWRIRCRSAEESTAAGAVAITWGSVARFAVKNCNTLTHPPPNSHASQVAGAARRALEPSRHPHPLPPPPRRRRRRRSRLFDQRGACYTHQGQPRPLWCGVVSHHVPGAHAAGVLRCWQGAQCRLLPKLDRLPR